MSTPRLPLAANWLTFFGFLASFCLGCSPSDDGASKDVFTSEGGAYSLWLSGAEPQRGENSLELCVLELASGEAPSELELETVPYMPAMGHGSSGPSVATAVGDGCYRFDGVRFTMPGTWELRTTLWSEASEDTVVAQLYIK